MLRQIIKIDDEKCTGCGICASACVEGAIKMINGKAVLVNESYCDGLGACLPSCPAEAISMEMREAKAFADPHKPAQTQQPLGGIPMACPGSGMRRIQHEDVEEDVSNVPSRLSQWPIQLRLVPAAAPFFDDCDLLIAADCSAFAYGNYHERFIKGRVVIIGCPKLDPTECWEKLRDIFSLHHIKSVTVTRMDVPCCSNLVNAVNKALTTCKNPPEVKTYIVYGDGKIE